MLNKSLTLIHSLILNGIPNKGGFLYPNSDAFLSSSDAHVSASYDQLEQSLLVKQSNYRRRSIIHLKTLEFMRLFHIHSSESEVNQTSIKRVMQLVFS